ncbi:MAG: aminomethyl-transferring glycine dehydrogenase [Cytophagales bacterium]|nr:aminomethyl-transferring glycine dehydrogenase [Cytophagales bacterium]
MLVNLNKRAPFEHRHNGPDRNEQEEMLKAIGAESIDDLIQKTIPVNIRLKQDLNLPEALDEYQYLTKMKQVAQKNEVRNSFIGQGYYNCEVPTVILRNVLENPAWYTAYTPYQAEIAQGRLEALINFQTLVIDLTQMEIANASLLDEGTAAAEAMTMFFGLRKGAKKKSATKYLVDHRVFPQTLEVLKTRALPMGIEVEIVDIDKADLTSEEVFGVYFQYPDNDGEVIDRSSLTAAANENQVFVGVGTDLLALCLFEGPGKWGVDAVVGTSQRFGVPLGFGGPHAAFFATKEQYKRAVPGRMIGASKDAEGNDAFRMALQTREQHIKRERATSNICTAQVLLAVMSSMYAVYHGPAGLRDIALRVKGLAQTVADRLGQANVQVVNNRFFDTVKFISNDLDGLKARAAAKQVNVRYLEDNFVSISFDETHRLADAELILEVILGEATTISSEVNLGDDFRPQDYLQHSVFNSYQSEHEMLRYMKKLESKDLSLVHSMISLGSCTMKLNATTEMIPVTWSEFGDIHPYAPKEQTQGYQELIGELGTWLCEITGFHSVSFQPNSGAQGEYTGLMVIRAYHLHRGDTHRNIALIPSSAHGTNPASAVMAGMKVVIVKCDDEGNIDVEDLRAKATEHSANLAALMVTYPSTHGVFEASIIEICDIIHQNGGQVYMDGANMNAQVGLTSPANIGADVCHLNLHKTFCIPHGGGGPGMGPIGVVEHLAPYLPKRPTDEGLSSKITAVSSAEYGSASILPISHAYIAMMGGSGLTNATKIAILNANYIKSQISEAYPVLYSGENDTNAHELIIDCRHFKAAGIEVEDIAKRLMDYGYHAPTVSFPVPGTMMIEPTESETKAELDRFCSVMLAIRAEIEEVLIGVADKDNNVLKNAPHTQRVVLAEQWDKPYAREKAAFPLPELRFNKFWPAVSRIDSAYGDRNLICSCLPISSYEEVEEEVMA